MLKIERLACEKVTFTMARYLDKFVSTAVVKRQRQERWSGVSGSTVSGLVSGLLGRITCDLYGNTQQTRVSQSC